MTTIKIRGMSCNHCVMAVTKALNGIEGIKNVKVDLRKGEATFEMTKPVPQETLKAQVKKAGFDVE